MSQENSSNPIPMIIVAVVVIAGALWFFKDSLFPTEQQVVVQPVAQETPATPDETTMSGAIKRPAMPDTTKNIDVARETLVVEKPCSSVSASR